MTSLYLSNLVVGSLVGWLTALSAGLVGYLVTLKLQELRRNRRMDAERERLGLPRA